MAQQPKGPRSGGEERGPTERSSRWRATVFIWGGVTGGEPDRFTVAARTYLHGATCRQYEWTVSVLGCLGVDRATRTLHRRAKHLGACPTDGLPSGCPANPPSPNLAMIILQARLHYVQTLK